MLPQMGMTHCHTHLLQRTPILETVGLATLVPITTLSGIAIHLPNIFQYRDNLLMVLEGSRL